MSWNINLPTKPTPGTPVSSWFSTYLIHFDKMLTPVAVRAVYGVIVVVGAIGIFLGAIGWLSATQAPVPLLIVVPFLLAAIVVVTIRMCCEMVIVVFSIHENIRKLADQEAPADATRVSAD